MTAPVTIHRYQVVKAGLQVGRVGPALRDMPRDRMAALLDEAARTGKTLAEVLADHWRDAWPCKS
jgi:hypothetical protein